MNPNDITHFMRQNGLDTSDESYQQFGELLNVVNGSHSSGTMEVSEEVYYEDITLR